MNKIVHALLFTALAGCATEEVSGPGPAPLSEAEHLAVVAEEISGLIDDQAMREAIAARLGGDRDAFVLLGGLALPDGTPIATALGLSEAEAAQIQLRAPLGLAAAAADWMVAALPEGDDPQALAYYQHGAIAGTLTADRAPDGTVLVVEPADPAESIEAEGAPRAAGVRHVRLKGIKIYDDGEALPLDNPELYLACDFPDAPSIKIYLPNVNDVGHWYSRDKFIVNWYESYGSPMLCAYYDEDSGSLGTVTFDFTAPYVQLHYELPVRNNDDDLGHTLINFADPSGTIFSTGAVDFKLSF